MIDTSWSSAGAIASAVTRGELAATQVIERHWHDIARRDTVLNAFTTVTAERALARAATQPTGPLAGVPFAVKNLIDIAGLPTLAGSKINREHPPAAADATLVARLEAAGAILVGALNMGEYAYDFTGENSHDGPSRNPHDTTRMTGGSSGGSGGAVAGGLVPIALGSDTNGSIRVPASFCGIFGLKPTYGRLSRAGSFPFVSSLDHLGPFARNTTDLALAYDAMTGPDPRDPVCTDRVDEPVCPALAAGIAGLRIASAGGYFRAGAGRRGAGRAGRRRQGARRDAADRIARSSAGTRRGLCHHHIRGRRPAPASSSDPTARLRPRRARPADRRRHGASRLGGARAEVPALVSRCGAAPVRGGRRDHRARHALRRTADRSEDTRAERTGGAAAAQHRHLHAADLVHRSAGGRRAGATATACRSPCRSSPLPGAKMWHCASPTIWRHAASRVRRDRRRA